MARVQQSFPLDGWIASHLVDEPRSVYLYPPSPHTSWEGCCGRFRARGCQGQDCPEPSPTGLGVNPGLPSSGTKGVWEQCMCSEPPSELSP